VWLGRLNEMALERAKERLKNFRLFESLSNPRKCRKRAIKRMSSSSDEVSKMSLRSASIQPLRTIDRE
jgi:hypothetical protein